MNRNEDEGRRLMDVGLRAALELAGFPGDEDEARAIVDGVMFALEEADPDDFESVVAVAGAFMDNVGRENHGR